MSGWLKADLHIHTKEDVIDRRIIPYTTKELIRMAKKQDFDVIAVTNHKKPTVTQEMIDMALDQDIVLLPGVEAQFGARHVLVIAPQLPVPVPKKFNDLRAMKQDGYLIIAPHPYFPPPSSLGSLTEKHIDAFHAIEYSHFYTSWNNMNKKAVLLSEKYNLPLVGTSDMHRRDQLGYTFTMIESEARPESIIQAVIQNRIKMVTKPLRTDIFLLRAAFKSIKTVLVDVPRYYFFSLRR